MSTGRRDWLIRLRKDQEWTQDDLADRIGVDPGTVGRWERGVHPIRPNNKHSLATAFGISIRQLNLLASPSADSPASVTPAVTLESPPPVLVPELEGPIASLRSVIDGSRGLDHTIGPTGTLELVRSQLAIADQLAGTVRTEAGRRSLVGLTGQIHQLAGWMSFDTRNMTAARASFAHAREAARQADDPALLAYVLGPSAAFAEADSGDPAAGLDLAFLAVGHARRSGNKRLLAFVLAITGRVHAKLGDEALARQALDDAATALGEHDGWDDDPLWLEVFDETALLGHSGSCDLDLGRPKAAVELLDRQDSAAPDTFVRNRAIWRLDRAAAFQTLDELDQAAANVVAALDLIGTTSSPRTRFKLAQLAEALITDQRAPEIGEELLDRLRDHSAGGTHSGR